MAAMVHQDAQPMAAVRCLQDDIGADGGDGKAPRCRRIQDVALDRFPAVHVVLAHPEPVRRPVQQELPSRVSQYASPNYGGRFCRRRHQLLFSAMRADNVVLGALL